MRLSWMSWLVAVGLLAAVPAWGSQPLELLKSQDVVVRKIIVKPTVKGTPEHTAKENELRRTINQLFDFQELGKRSLSENWDGLDAGQRTEFVDLLQRLIERNYLLKITKATSYELVWFPEQQAAGYTNERFKIKSNKYKAAIQLKMIQKGGKWVVFDMVIDDVSLLENYHSQFNKIIREKGFPKLIKRMKRKLTELENNDSASGDLDKGAAIKSKKKNSF